jgi:hypothetical protein
MLRTVSPRGRQGLLGDAAVAEARRQGGGVRPRVLFNEPRGTRAAFAGLTATLDPADGLWIAWPKKAAKIENDLDFDAVQRIGLAAGLVDNKSAAIDDRWQALRFVYRLEDR